MIAMRGRRRATGAASVTFLVAAAILSLLAGCDGRARDGARAPSPAHAAIIVPSPTGTPRPNAGGVTETPGTAVVIQTADITLTTAAHLDFSGHGFSPGEGLAVSIVDAQGKTEMSLAPAQAGTTGHLGPVSLVMPADLAPGTHVLVVEGQTSHHVGSAEFHVARIPPTVQLDSYSAEPGYGFGIHGSGFAAGEAVAVYLGSEVGRPLATLTAGPGGDLTGHVNVPAHPAGVYTLYVVGQVSATPAMVAFAVRGFKPWVVLQDYAPSVGSALIASGRDFAPNERVSVYLNVASGQPIASIQADPQGTFTNEQGPVVSASLMGRQTLIFVGERSQRPYTVPFEVLPGAGGHETPSPNVGP
jgi:hypothetical protein